MAPVSLSLRAVAPHYPRLEHLRRHVRSLRGQRGTHALHATVLELLLEPLTIEEIARRVPEPTTWRQVDHAWTQIQVAIGLNGSTVHLRRMALLRIAMGLDPCWCEG